MTLKRKLLAGLCLLLAVVFLVVGIRYRDIERHLGTRLEDALASRAGVDAELQDVRLHSFSSASVARVTARRGGASVVCEGIEVSLSALSMLTGDLRAEEVTVVSCTAELQDDAAAEVAPEAPAAERGQAPWVTLAPLLGVATVGHVDATVTRGGQRIDVRLDEVSVTGGAALQLRAAGSMTGAVRHDVSELTVIADSAAVVARWPGSFEVADHPVRAEFQTVSYDRGGALGLSGLVLAATFRDVSVDASVADVTLDRSGPVPSVVLRGARLGHLDVAQLRAALAPPPPPPAPEPRRRRSEPEVEDDRPVLPPIVPPALDALHAALTQGFELLERAVATELPRVELTMHDTVLADIAGKPLSIGVLRWVPSEDLSASLVYDGLEVDFVFQPDLSARQVIDLRNFSLDRLGTTLGHPGALSGLANVTIAIQPDVVEHVLTAAIQFDLQGVEVGLPGLSPERLVGMTAYGDLTGRIAAKEALAIEIAGNVRLSGIASDFRAKTSGAAGRYELEVEAGTTTDVQCADVYAAIPAGMLPNLSKETVVLTGAARPRLVVEYEFGTPDSFDFDVTGMPGTCRVAEIGGDYDPDRLNRRSFVHEVTEGTTVGTIRVGPGTDDFEPIDGLPSYVPALMYLSEEINFYGNPGISIPLMNKGMRLNLERRRYAYGGSTVSQQLVKNLFFQRNKTLSRKLEEALVVWAMEERVSKDRILELYLNCIEFGPNVFGIHRAAEYYFGKRPQELTPLEAAFLAALKPSPLSGGHYRSQGFTPADGWMAKRIGEILARLVQYGGHITQAEVDHYAPFAVTLTASPNAALAPPPIARPVDAIQMDHQRRETPSR